MNAETSLIIAPAAFSYPVSLHPNAHAAKELALSSSALIGKVTNRAENDACVASKKQIKTILLTIERQRKTLKEPIIEAGRTLDRACEAFKLELDQELGRLEELEKEFLREEARRVEEERRRQQEELERIERERQAELRRIEQERLAAERKAREEVEAKARAEREAAAQLAREATNKAQREAAEKARIEAEARAESARQQAAIDAEAARVAAEKAAQAVQECADVAAHIESRHIPETRASGQVVRKVWVIDQINDFQLMKARPDLVRKIEWDMVNLKAALESSGGKLPGVTAHEDIKAGTRQGKQPLTLDV